MLTMRRAPLATRDDIAANTSKWLGSRRAAAWRVRDHRLTGDTSSAVIRRFLFRPPPGGNGLHPARVPTNAFNTAHAA